jgi:hypothetical protein
MASASGVWKWAEYKEKATHVLCPVCTALQGAADDLSMLEAYHLIKELWTGWWQSMPEPPLQESLLNSGETCFDIVRMDPVAKAIAMTARYDFVVNPQNRFLKELKGDGWILDVNNKQSYDLFKVREGVFVGVYGWYDVGKSWLVKQLTKRDDIPDGKGCDTRGISGVYPVDEESHSRTIYLDAAGGQRPVHADDFFERKSTDEALEDLMLTMCGVMVLVVDTLTFEQQAAAYSLLRKIRDTVNVDVIFVHNFKSLDNTGQVTYYIQEDIEKAMGATKREGLKEWEVSEHRTNGSPLLRRHFVMVNDRSDLAKDYNMYTIQRLLDLVGNSNGIQPLDPVEVVKMSLPKILKPLIEPEGQDASNWWHWLRAILEVVWDPWNRKRASTADGTSYKGYEIVVADSKDQKGANAKESYIFKLKGDWKPWRTPGKGNEPKHRALLKRRNATTDFEVLIFISGLDDIVHDDGNDPRCPAVDTRETPISPDVCPPDDSSCQQSTTGRRLLCLRLEYESGQHLLVSGTESVELDGWESIGEFNFPWSFKFPLSGNLDVDNPDYNYEKGILNITIPVKKRPSGFGKGKKP